MKQGSVHIPNFIRIIKNNVTLNLPTTGKNNILAAGSLYSWGIVLSPAIGAVMMSVSTISCGNKC